MHQYLSGNLGFIGLPVAKHFKFIAPKSSFVKKQQGRMLFSNSDLRKAG
jgi:hypothetical protein